MKWNAIYRMPNRRNSNMKRMKLNKNVCFMRESKKSLKKNIYISNKNSFSCYFWFCYESTFVHESVFGEFSLFSWHLKTSSMTCATMQLTKPPIKVQNASSDITAAIKMKQDHFCHRIDCKFLVNLNSDCQMCRMTTKP